MARPPYSLSLAERTFPTPVEIAQQVVADRDRARHDLFFLANEILGYDFCWEVHAELFACFPKLDASKPWAQQSEIKDTLILWPRGHYKTTAVICFIVQIIINFPNVRVLLMSGGMALTRENLFVPLYSHFRGTANGSRLREIFPEFCGTKEELSAKNNSLTAPARTQRQLGQPTVSVASPNSVKTGQHYDFLAADDLVNEKNYTSAPQLEKVFQQFSLAQALIDPGGYRVVTGTRYSHGDLYDRILRWQAKSGKWTVSVKNCWADGMENTPDDKKRVRFPVFTKKNGEAGGYSLERLLQMQDDDPATFACQYLNLPVHASQQAYTDEMMEAALVPEKETPPLSQPLLVIDLASTDTLRANESAIAVGRIDSLGVGYLCDIRGKTWTPYDLALNVIDMSLRHRPVKVLIEKTTSAVYFADFLRLIARQKNVFLPIDFIKIDTSFDAKAMRITALAGVIKRGRFKFFAGLPDWGKLKMQACDFPRNWHGRDDYIDITSHLYRELCKEIMILPVKATPKSAILAMIGDAEHNLHKALVGGETRDLDDQTGLGD